MNDCILNKLEAAARTGLSTRTLDRNSEQGIGPPRIHLSKRRIGYRESDLTAWLQSRTSPAKRPA